MVVARALQPLECRTLAKGISQGLGRDRTGLLISDLGDVSCPAATVGLGGARRCLCSSVGLSQRNEQNFVDEYQNLGISVSLAFFAITQGAFQSFSGYALSILEARSILPLKGKNNNPNVGMQRKRGHGQDHRSFLEESLDYCGDQGFFVTCVCMYVFLYLSDSFRHSAWTVSFLCFSYKISLRKSQL